MKRKEQDFSPSLARLKRVHVSILFWALLVGILTGLVGAAFRIGLESIGRWREAVLVWAGSMPDWALGVPVAISALAVFAALLLVRRVAPETGGSGVQEIEGALDGVRPVRWKRVLPVKFVAGWLSLGAGMVLGREGPTIQMGGNLGKMIGDWFRVSRDDLHILLAAGAAAGLSAAFNAPLSGVLFVIEEMRLQFKYSFLSVQAVLIASASADVVVRGLTGQAPVISMPHLSDPHLSSLWLFLVFGAVFGFFGLLFNKFLVSALDLFSSMRGWPYRLTGLYMGAFIGLLAIVLPDAVGGGYHVIFETMHGKLPVMMLILLFAARFGTTVLSYGCGVPGGIFAPMLALGTLFGMWFGHYAHAWLPGLIAHPSVFMVAGMSALFAATVRAPLTGIGLAVEMTGNYELLLPLILTCISATVVAEGLGGKPIYTVLLQRTLDREQKAAQALPTEE